MKENLIILVLTAAYVRTSIQSLGEGLHPRKPSFLDRKIRVIWFCSFIYFFVGGGGGGGGSADANIGRIIVLA